MGTAKVCKVVCTGETMEDSVKESFPELQLSQFQPKHTVRLDNKYACFANFDIDAPQQPASTVESAASQ
jgi:hypothetical protein